MKRYRQWSPRQSFLLPPSPMDWLPEGHLAFYILDVVSELDLAPIEHAIQSKDPRGERPHAPQMMVALLLYAYCVGVFSSRKIARATYEDVAFRVIAGDVHPHFTTINAFRLHHREAFKHLFVHVLRLCQHHGLVKLGHVAFDGTKVQANASKHKAMSYERMTETEQRLQAEVEQLLARADHADQDEDARLGIGNDELDLPQELARRETRLARIREAKAALEHEAKLARAAQMREQARANRRVAEDSSVSTKQRKSAATRAARREAAAQKLAPKDDNEDDTSPNTSSEVALPSHRVPTTVDGKPKANAQRNFTDPDSRIMKVNQGFVQGYNAQIAVDEAHQIIVAQAVTNQPPDCEHARPMVERVIANCGAVPENASMDNGYFSADNITFLEEQGIDAHVSIGRHHDDPMTTDASDDTPARRARARMRDKLKSERGRKIYARRKVIVEPPFGQIKQARGFRRFSLRGLDKVCCEWSLVTLTHNLLKLHRALAHAPTGPPALQPFPARSTLA